MRVSNSKIILPSCHSTSSFQKAYNFASQARSRLLKQLAEIVHTWAKLKRRVMFVSMPCFCRTSQALIPSQVDAICRQWANQIPWNPIPRASKKSWAPCSIFSTGNRSCYQNFQTGLETRRSCGWLVILMANLQCLKIISFCKEKAAGCNKLSSLRFVTQGTQTLLWTKRSCESRISRHTLM